MLQVSTRSGVENGVWLHSKTTLSVLPSLFILHEPSMFFLSEGSLDPNSPHWTISSYMMLITHALSCLSFLSKSTGVQSSGVAFALFDSQLDQLRLPILKQPISDHSYDPGQPRRRTDYVATFVQRYFEWVAAFSQDEDDSPDSTRRKHMMKLYRPDCSPDAVRSWTWWEAPSNECRGTQIFWEI